MHAALLLSALAGSNFECRGEEESASFVARLIRDMTDPLDLARLPDKQEFTYHVASSVDPKGGKGILATLDHYVSKDEKGHAVLADLQGPGCVRRMYFAGAPQGGAADLLGGSRAIAFYFDGEKEPRFKTTLQTLAQDIVDWKGITPFPHAPAAPLVGQGGGGYYCYLPLVYERSLKIVLDASSLKRFSYQIGYHTYADKPEGMKSFDRAELGRALADPTLKLIPRVTDPEVSPVTGMRLRERVVPQALLEPGKEVEALLEGPGIIREVEVQWTRADNAQQRGLVLRCYWDGETHPSVETPLDDLFGFDHGNKARVNLYLLDREDSNGGLRRGRLWLPMPFRKSARFTITNELSEAVPLAFTIRHARLRELGDDLGYLHAFWTRSMARETEGVASTPSAHTLLELSNAGRFVGCMLSINKLRSGRDYLQYGETLGVDGYEIRGSAMDHFFNGYDKYHNRFNAAYHAVPIQRGGNLTQFRFFIPDSVPFQKAFKLSFPNPDGEDLSSIAFWYQRQPHAPFSPLQAAQERARFHRIFLVPGALEAENLKVELSTRYLRPAVVPMEDLDDGQWSNNRQLYVSCDVAGAGSWFALKVPVERASRYEVKVYMTKGEGFSDVALYVNDVRCKVTDEQGVSHELFEGKSGTTLPSGALSLGVHELKEGTSLVKFENATREKSGRRESTDIGVDCIVLIPEGASK